MYRVHTSGTDFPHGLQKMNIRHIRPAFHAGSEHEMIKQQLRTPFEEFCEGYLALIAIEDIMSFYLHHGKLLSGHIELVI